jgi:hypothetical protein
MAWDQIYDLYNSSLEADKFLSDQALAEIKSQIETITAANQPFSLSIDLYTFPFVDANNNPVIPQLDQMVRIADLIQFSLRSIGIRCSAPLPQYLFPYSTPTITNMILFIEWFLRDDREYMKQYY